MAAQAIQKLPWPNNSCGGLGSWPGISPRTETVKDSVFIKKKTSLQRKISHVIFCFTKPQFYLQEFISFRNTINAALHFDNDRCGRPPREARSPSHPPCSLTTVGTDTPEDFVVGIAHDLFNFIFRFALYTVCLGKGFGSKGKQHCKRTASGMQNHSM